MKMAWLVWLLCLLWVVGCSTITPDNVNNDLASPDDSTPLRYRGVKVSGVWITEFNGGFLFYDTVDGARCGVLTSNGRDDYNQLIDKYRLQIQDTYGILLEKDQGILPYIDQYGNRESNGKTYRLYSITKQRLKYFMLMQQWSRNHREQDSIWLKIKSKIVP